MGGRELWGGVGPHTYIPSPSPMSARWEEEYTVRIQLQERVNELQEVRAAHHCVPSTLPPRPLATRPLATPQTLSSPGPSLSSPAFCIDSTTNRQGFLPNCRKPKRLMPAKRSWP